MAVGNPAPLSSGHRVLLGGRFSAAGLGYSFHKHVLGLPLLQVPRVRWIQPAGRRYDDHVTGDTSKLEFRSLPKATRCPSVDLPKATRCPSADLPKATRCPSAEPGAAARPLLQVRPRAPPARASHRQAGQPESHPSSPSRANDRSHHPSACGRQAEDSPQNPLRPGPDLLGLSFRLCVGVGGGSQGELFLATLNQQTHVEGPVLQVLPHSPLQ